MEARTYKEMFSLPMTVDKKFLREEFNSVDTPIEDHIHVIYTELPLNLVEGTDYSKVYDPRVLDPDPETRAFAKPFARREEVKRLIHLRKSLKEHGALLPIVAWNRNDGTYRARNGEEKLWLMRDIRFEKIHALLVYVDGDNPEWIPKGVKLFSIKAMLNYMRLADTVQLRIHGGFISLDASMRH